MEVWPITPRKLDNANTYRGEMVKKGEATKEKKKKKPLDLSLAREHITNIDLSTFVFDENNGEFIVFLFKMDDRDYLIAESAYYFNDYQEVRDFLSRNNLKNFQVFTAETFEGQHDAIEAVSAHFG